MKVSLEPLEFWTKIDSEKMTLETFSINPWDNLNLIITTQ